MFTKDIILIKGLKWWSPWCYKVDPNAEYLPLLQILSEFVPSRCPYAFGHWRPKMLVVPSLCKYSLWVLAVFFSSFNAAAVKVINHVKWVIMTFLVLVVFFICAEYTGSFSQSPQLSVSLTFIILGFYKNNPQSVLYFISL